MPVSNAWLLTFSDTLHAAVGNLEIIYLLSHIPKLIEVPHRPVYSRYIVAWQNQQLPLMDIRLFLTGNRGKQADSLQHSKALAGIVAYHSPESGVQKYGALLLSELPVRTVVDDKQMCGLPESPDGWVALAISCFNHDDYGPVPILDLPRIFSSISV